MTTSLVTLVPPMPKVSPIIKPVAALCNLSCDYCYYKNTHTFSANGLKMSDDVLEKVISDVLAIALKNNAKAEFTWHGGEPTLAGLDFYKKVVDLQYEKALGQDIEIDNNIQTNGTLIDEEWMQFSKEHGISYGISLDGPKWLHDIHRYYSNGLGSFDIIMKNIRLLQMNDIKFGIIAVVTHEAIGHAKEIIDFFIGNDILQFELSPCAELPGTNGDKLTISPDEYASFMIEAFDHWLTLDNPDIHIRFLEQIVYGLFGAKPGLCSMNSDTCGVFPTITPNGNVFFCDNYEGSEDMFVGNIMEQSLSDILFLPKGVHQKMRLSIYQAKMKCITCEWYHVCGGGCPRYMRSSPFAPFQDVNYFCPAYKQIIGHVAQKLIDMGYDILPKRLSAEKG